MIALPAEIAVALVALLILLAIEMLYVIVRYVVPDVPIVGGVIRNALLSALDAVRSAIWGFLKALTRPVLDVLWRFGLWQMRMWGWAANALEQIPAALYGVGATASSVAHGLFGAAQTHTEDRYNQATNLANLLHGLAENDIILARQAASAQVAAAQAAAGAEVASAQARADQEVARARADASSQVAAATATAAAGLSLERVHADNLFTSSQASLQTAVQGLQGQLGTAVQGLEGYATGAADAAAAASAAGVLSQVLPQLRTITTELDSCLRPLCDTVTPNAGQLGGLGKLFSTLETIGADGSMLALLLFLLTDRHAASDIAGAVDSVGRPVAAEIAALV